MKTLILTVFVLVPLACAAQERVGITALPLHVFDDATMPGKELRVHASHVVFYVLQGAGIGRENGRAPPPRSWCSSRS